MHETAGLPTSNYHVCPLLEDLTLGNLQEQTTPRLRGAGVTLIVVGFVHQDCSAKADTWSASATPTRSAGGLAGIVLGCNILISCTDPGWLSLSGTPPPPAAVTRTLVQLDPAKSRRMPEVFRLGAAGSSPTSVAALCN